MTCDRCGESVLARWVIFCRAGLLYLCNHHFREHAPAILLRFRVHDMQEDLADGHQRVGW